MQKGYGQFCPLAKAAELLCERWTMIVIRELVAGSRKFNDLKRGLPLISPTLLSRRLKQLTAAGVIEKVVENGSPAYALTLAGKELEPLVKVMAVWGHRWVQSQFEEQDLDVGLLMWDIRRGAEVSAFPPKRTVLEFRFSDAPKGMQQWWLVCDNGVIDLCLEDAGFEVDVMIQSPVRTLTEVWMQARDFDDAMKCGGLSLLGPSELTQQLPGWLPGSSLARMGAVSLDNNPRHEQGNGTPVTDE